MGVDAVDLFTSSVKTVKTQFEFNIDVNDHAAGNANCQTQQVDNGIHPFVKNIANGSFEVIFDHRPKFTDRTAKINKGCSGLPTGQLIYTSFMSVYGDIICSG